MRYLKVNVLLILLLAALVSVQGKTKKPYVLPAVFNNARYVYVEAVDGQQFDPRLIADDREAIANVQNALNDWKRYTLVTRRKDADLIIVVRTGRLAEAGVGVQGSTGPQGAPSQPPGQGGRGVGVGLRADAGPSDDLFEVFLPNPNDELGSMLWMRSLPDGLSGPNPVIFKQFKNAVESAYPNQTASQPKKP